MRIFNLTVAQVMFSYTWLNSHDRNAPAKPEDKSPMAFREPPRNKTTAAGANDEMYQLH